MTYDDDITRSQLCGLRRHGLGQRPVSHWGVL